MDKQTYFETLGIFLIAAVFFILGSVLGDPSVTDLGKLIAGVGVGWLGHGAIRGGGN